MYRNRVNPIGEIISTPARGNWLGNRGVIHNHDKEIIRLFKHKAWIICQLSFKGRKRSIMTPDRWTELFFLDEATAFSAGHRPCFECRREDASRFKSSWIKGNPEFELTFKTRIGAIDEILQKDRMGTNGTKITYVETISMLPDGTFVLIDNEPHLVYKESLFRWTPFGYEAPLSRKNLSDVIVLTPRSVVNAFASGYLPTVHHSALNN